MFQTLLIYLLQFHACKDSQSRVYWGKGSLLIEYTVEVNQLLKHGLLLPFEMLQALLDKDRTIHLTGKTLAGHNSNLTGDPHASGGTAEHQVFCST